MDLVLRGYATAVLRDRPVDELSTLAGQLDELVAVVTGNGGLAGALSDVAVPAAARRGVLQDLFASRVAPPVLRLVLHAVDIERGPALLPALHDVAELTRLFAEHPAEAEAADDRPLGHAAVRRLLAGEATAELEAVEAVGALESIEDQLFRFARTAAANPPLRAALSDWAVPSARRGALAETLLGGKADPVTVRLAVAAARVRSRDVVAILDWMAGQVAEARGWRVATVRAAMDVDEHERRRLGEAMAHLTGRPVEVRVTVDRSLIGGAQVTVGDLLVDATTRHRLDQLQELLQSPEGAVRSLLGDTAEERRR